MPSPWVQRLAQSERTSTAVVDQTLGDCIPADRVSIFDQVDRLAYRQNVRAEDWAEPQDDGSFDVDGNR